MFYPIMKRVVEIELHTTQQQSSGGGDEVELGGKRVGRRPRESMFQTIFDEDCRKQGAAWPT